MSAGTAGASGGVPPGANGTAARGDRILWAVLGLVLVTVAGAGIWRALARSRAPSLEVLGSLPDFSLVERSGRLVTSRDLRGSIWVADFIFTRCSGICPVLSTALADVQRRASASVKLVSFSVDPLHDTPEVLRDYARGYGADPARWLFLTGDRAAIHALVRDGFRLSVAELPEGATAPAGELVTHSDRMVLVDPELRIRGYYHGTDRAEVERLLGDVKRIEAEVGS